MNIYTVNFYFGRVLLVLQNSVLFFNTFFVWSVGCVAGEGLGLRGALCIMGGKRKRRRNNGSACYVSYVPKLMLCHTLELAYFWFFTAGNGPPPLSSKGTQLKA